jgi:hypothetical protein
LLMRALSIGFDEMHCYLKGSPLPALLVRFMISIRKTTAASRV